MRNDVSGTVTGPVIQAGHISGSVTVAGRAAQPGLVSVAVPAGRLTHETRGRARLIRAVLDIVHGAPGQVVVLHGAGGYGKTTIALRVAQDVADEIRVWWVDASGATSLTEGLAEVALQAGADPERVRAAWAGSGSAPDVLWQALTARPDRWLLVLDNADDPRVLAAGGRRVDEGTGWLRASPTCHGTVLVTTRDQGVHTWGTRVLRYRVPLLDPAEGGQVLRDLAPAAGGVAEAERLSGRLGGLPLALRLAGNYLAATTTLPALPGLAQARYFADYHATLDRSFVELTEPFLAGTDATERELLSRTWELSLDLLVDRGQPLARPLLRLLACLAPAPVPYFLLDASVLAASPLFDGVTAQQLAGLLTALAGMGLLDDEADPVPGVQLHLVVRDTNRHQQDFVARRDRYAGLCLALLERATRDLDPENPDTWARWHAVLPHCVSASEWDLPDRASLRLSAATVAQRAAYFCGEIAQYRKAVDLNQRAADAQHALLGAGHPDTLETRHNLAWAMGKLGATEQAETAFRDIRAVAEEALGAEHPRTLAARHQVATWLHVRGALAEAETEFQEVLAIRQRVLGRAHPDTRITRHNLARVLRDSGDLNQAETEFRDILATELRVLGAEHPHTLGTRSNLASVLYARGAVREAEAEFQEILTVRRRILGAEHPGTLLTRYNLAKMRHDQGAVADAERELRDILAIQQRLLGNEHQHTMITRARLRQWVGHD